MSSTPLQRFSLWIATLAAWAAVAGSLFFSEVLALPPCDLCWWQRVLFYPLAWIFPAALLRRDHRGAVWYGFPLAFGGWLIALYQSLLQWGLIDQSSFIPCSVGNPCGIVSWSWLNGLVTIPAIALAGFTVVLLSLFPLMRRNTVIRPTRVTPAPAPVARRLPAAPVVAPAQKRRAPVKPSKPATKRRPAR